MEGSSPIAVKLVEAMISEDTEKSSSAQVLLYTRDLSERSKGGRMRRCGKIRTSPFMEVAILFFAYSLVIGFLYVLPGDLVYR
jgi:hypothetical protein